MKKNRIRPEQVQDFYPTPGTLSTCMYYTGIDPRDGKSIYIPRSPQEKEMQRALMQYFMPRNRVLVMKALHEAGRDDLIGFSEKCLVAPREVGAGRGEDGKRRGKPSYNSSDRIKADRSSGKSQRGDRPSRSANKDMRSGHSNGRARKPKHPGR